MNLGFYDALHAMGPQTGHFIDLWRIFVVLCTVVFGIILAVLLLALRRAPRAREAEPPDLSMVNRPEPGPRRGVVTAVSLSILGLLALIAASVITDRALASLPLKDALNVEVTGHQWWWTVRYLDGAPNETLVTANELHVPLGRPVILQLKADDVIHSLWIPNLAGKKDLIPGRTAVLTFRADRPGQYAARCAEYCGYQHANMALTVHVHPAPEFEAWRRRQLAVPPPPTDARAQRGQLLFQSVSCAMCHTVQGTIAQGKRAPDLTHVASRATLAAGTLPNTPEMLASWISNPQQHKPATHMPATPLSPDDLAALVAYLGTLK